jgi:hypothetical protein
LGYRFSSYVELLSSWVVVAVLLTATLTTSLTTTLTSPFISLLTLFTLKLVLAILNNL